MWRWISHLLAIAAVGGVAGCGLGGDEGEGTGRIPVVLQTDWYPQPEHGGYYHALLTGGYERAGLDVEIRPGANMTNIPQLVATGRIDFALGTTDNLLIASSRGIPLVGVFPHFQHDPQCIMAREQAGVDTLESLDGKTVMMNPGLPHVRFLQRSLGIRLQLVPMDFSLTRFLSDPTFIQQCFVTSEPYYVGRQGIEPTVLRLSDSGFDSYRIAYASAAYVAANPEVVSAFVRASRDGWAGYIGGDGDLVHERLAELNPQQTADFMAWTKQAMVDFQLVHGDAEAGEVLGRLRHDRLQEQLGQLEALDMLDGPVSLREAFAAHLMPPELVQGFPAPTPPEVATAGGPVEGGGGPDGT